MFSSKLLKKTPTMATRAIAISKVAAPAPRGVAQRHLSTSGVIAVEKLRNAIEAYRREKWVPNDESSITWLLHVFVCIVNVLSRKWLTISLDTFHKQTTHSYVHELPSRCKKDMLAVADKNKDGRIPVEGIETLLRNIGASDCMSRAEIETILSEEGESHAKVIERGELEPL